MARLPSRIYMTSLAQNHRYFCAIQTKDGWSGSCLIGLKPSIINSSEPIGWELKTKIA